MVVHPDSYEAVIDTPLDGVKLGINTKGGALYSIDFISPGHRSHVPPTGFIHEVAGQLRSYFENPRFTFSLPLVAQGTPFQRRVWRALQKIPAGVTRPYGRVAQHLATSPRAIGGACRANPVPIIVPCHRVVALDGPGGFSGQTRGHQLRIKNWLLTHESR